MSQIRSAYVAASSRQMAEAESMMDALRERGIRITVDWVVHVRADGSANRGLSEGQRRAAAEHDLLGVECADIVVLLVPPEGVPTAGAWVEIGYALALQIPVHAIGDCEVSIFTSLCRQWNAVDEFLSALDRGSLARGGECLVDR